MRAQLINKRANYINRKTSLSSRVIVHFPMHMWMLEYATDLTVSCLFGRPQTQLCNISSLNEKRFTFRANMCATWKWPVDLATGAVLLLVIRLPIDCSNAEVHWCFHNFSSSMLGCVSRLPLSRIHLFVCCMRPPTQQNNSILSLPLLKCAFHQRRIVCRRCVCRNWSILFCVEATD